MSDEEQLGKDTDGVIVLQAVDPDALFLRKELATGTATAGDLKRPFSVTLTTGGAILVELDNPRRVYGVEIRQVIDAALTVEAADLVTDHG